MTYADERARGSSSEWETRCPAFMQRAGNLACDKSLTFLVPSPLVSRFPREIDRAKGAELSLRSTSSHNDALFYDER